MAGLIVVLGWIVFGYFVATAAVIGWRMRRERRKRQKAWQAYYDYPREGSKRRPKIDR